MRSAPGLPMASTAPSSRRPTVGAMLLAQPLARAGRVAPVELVLAEAVVQPQPGAGHASRRTRSRYDDVIEHALPVAVDHGDVRRAR